MSAISPDARYIAFISAKGDGENLVIRQVSTGSEIELVPPDGSLYDGVTLSPDGNYVYVVRSQRENSAYADLLRVPVLGGTLVQLLRDIDSPVAFSPDGRQIAFVRGIPDSSEFQLVVAGADGSGEKILLHRPTIISTSLGTNLRAPAWSPDGRSIVYTTFE
jgi:Tol biopolymer transport system component